MARFEFTWFLRLMKTVTWFSHHNAAGKDDLHSPKFKDLFPRMYASTSYMKASSHASLCQDRLSKKACVLCRAMSEGTSGGGALLSTNWGYSLTMRNPKCGGYVLRHVCKNGSFGLQLIDLLNFWALDGAINAWYYSIYRLQYISYLSLKSKPYMNHLTLYFCAQLAFDKLPTFAWIHQFPNYHVRSTSFKCFVG